MDKDKPNQDKLAALRKLAGEQKTAPDVDTSLAWRFDALKELDIKPITISLATDIDVRVIEQMYETGSRKPLQDRFVFTPGEPVKYEPLVGDPYVEVHMFNGAPDFMRLENLLLAFSMYHDAPLADGSGAQEILNSLITYFELSSETVSILSGIATDKVEAFRTDLGSLTSDEKYVLNTVVLELKALLGSTLRYRLADRPGSL
ncbi:MAG: hypothetical protein LBN02_10370 [Oscillospiraceae bacterium]|nr:hypothetical protein [Oscillospiraceae bacterium]